MMEQMIGKNFVFVVSALICFFSVSAFAATVQVPAQNIPNGFEFVGNLRPTFYWITLETQSSSPRSENVLDVQGNILAKVTASYFASLKLEGTGRLLDGRVLNFAQFVNMKSGKREIRFRVCGPEAPYGYGYEGRILNAFHSLAVDPRLIPLDSQVFIPAAVGARLPDGTRHNGIFQAVDIGSAIQDYRMDVFTSFGDQSAVFEKNGLNNMKLTPVYVKKTTNK